MATPHRPAIDKQLESMPPLPITVTRVLEVTENPLSSANDLMKAILPDQTMCLAILKFANSVIYGRPKKVASLEMAIVVLGFDEIRTIVLGKAAVTAIRHNLREHRNNLTKFWEHAFTCGLAARIIADHLGMKSGQLFMAGLLHDFGKLAQLLAYPQQYDITTRSSLISNVTSLAEEQLRFSASHAAAGARLLQHWQFPDMLVAALRYHHAPEQANIFSRYALVVQLADFLAHCCTLVQQPDEQRLKDLLDRHLPEFLRQWQDSQLPWEETTLEYLYTWTKVDRQHGSAILDILAV